MTLLDETLGASLLGAVGSTLLFGVTLSQLYHFIVSDYKITTSLKLLVALIG
jgi:hypothetical protein